MATQGPLYSSTQTQVTGTPDVTWSNLSNLGANDGSYATVTLGGASDPSNLVKVSNFNFTIPTSAVINGITVEISRKVNNTEQTADNEVKLIKAGTVQTTNKASATNYTTSDVVATYGGPADLWGTTWTPSDINNIGFGNAFSCMIITSPSRIVSSDFIRITVNYTDTIGFNIAFV